jgi:hypothetical protein
MAGFTFDDVQNPTQSAHRTAQLEQTRARIRELKAQQALHTHSIYSQILGETIAKLERHCLDLAKPAKTRKIR